MPNSPTFEIGLTMAGAVSAGAYTAGVVDFLIEALDAWDAAKQRKEQDPQTEPLCPDHEVALRVISGASAGAIVGAIVAANIDRRWTPAHAGNARDPQLQNPLFQSWVKDVGIAKLLGTKDLEADAAPISALDGTALDAIAKSALSFQAPPIARRYVSNPMRCIFTLTNLTGVPFNYSLQGNTGKGQDLAMHADCMRFAVLGAGSAAAPGLRVAHDASYEYALTPCADPKWSNTAWQRFALTSLASGAFPLGLRPRALERNTSDYSGLLLAQADAAGKPKAISPAWPPTQDSKYQFLSVDGGCVSNEPLELARVELSGSPLLHNPRKGEEADKAVIMIDPFIGPDKPGPRTVTENPLVSSLFNLLGATIAQARFSAENIALAQDPQVFSRFMIAPRRPTPPPLQKDGAPAEGQWIASGALKGFGGFLAQEFREHDFLLGRRNCQQFLAMHFTLPIENPLFANWREDETLVAQFGVPGQTPGSTELPIIPLVGSLHPRSGDAQALPVWPLGACDLDALRGPLSARADALFKKLAAGHGFMSFVVSAVWRIWGRKKLTTLALEKLSDALADQGLKPR
jgi:hypothetical protein